MSDETGEYLGIHRIHWHDANGRPGWHPLEEIAAPELMLVESVGWLIAENDTAVSLAMSRSDYRAGDVLTIPKATIVERWKL